MTPAARFTVTFLPALTHVGQETSSASSYKCNRYAFVLNIDSTGSQIWREILAYPYARKGLF